MIIDYCIDLPTSDRLTPQVLSTSPSRLITGRCYLWEDIEISNIEEACPEFVADRAIVLMLEVILFYFMSLTLLLKSVFMLDKQDISSRFTLSDRLVKLADCFDEFELITIDLNM